MSGLDGTTEIRISLARVLKKFGMKDLDANVFAELFLENRDLSIDNLKRRLNYSTSGITSSLHRLMRNNLVTRYKEGKKYLYRAEASILSALLHLIEEIKRYDIPILKRKLKEISSKEYHRSKLDMLKEKIEFFERHLSIIVGHLKKHEKMVL